MKMSSVFEAVKAAIPLPEAAKRYGLDASGTGMICCPFHEDHTPSMKLYEDHFYCFGCGRHGDLVDLLSELFCIPPYEAACKLADLSYRTVYDCFKRLVKKIGAPNARVHDLRHTYAVACIESGVDVKTLQENLGHATAAFTMDVYGHVSRQMQLNCASKLETFIQNVQPNRELEPASQAPETQEPCPI